MISFFYTLNFFFLLMGALAARARSGERHLAVIIVQILFFIPLLSCEYFYLSINKTQATSNLIFLSEVVFALISLLMAKHLGLVSSGNLEKPKFKTVLEFINITLLTVFAYFFIEYKSLIEISGSTLNFNISGPVFFASAFLLISSFYTIFRLIMFRHNLNTAQRMEYRFFIIGNALVFLSLFWMASYRIIFLSIRGEQLHLLSLLTLIGWFFILYAVFHHKLLYRKVFVSREIVYALTIPIIMGCYLLCFSLLTAIIHYFKFEFSFALKWLLLVIGFVLTALFAFSGKVRSRIHFFISTNFYVNKYEYRGEWLALSQNLQGAVNEREVIEALDKVLSDSLFTTDIFIWLGDRSKGYTLVSSPENLTVTNEKTISASDPLVAYLETHSHFDLKEREPDASWKKIKKNKRLFIDSLNIVLITPITIGTNLTGFIGLGPEYTGGDYNYDDFDLLSVIGSQTASALLAIRMSEELANTREQQAWNRLSAFVLHDIKNAATMLSMLQANAESHIHKPEFQKDMLELVDDAIKRMERVEQRLATLKDEIIPAFQSIRLDSFLKDCSDNLSAKLGQMKISIECDKEINVNTDPDLLFSVFENLLLNTYEEKNDAIVIISAQNSDNDEWAQIEITDNGPGIVTDLLPDKLFNPFITTKDTGSGIGLWQVKNVIGSIGGNISAENNEGAGSTFIIELPK